MKSVLVTGGDGFLGSNLVRELLGRGYRVRVFAERGRDAPNLAGLDVDIVRGDIRIAAEVSESVDGCNYVVHTAASTSMWPSRSDLQRQINVVGTENVIEAVLAHGVERMVHIGTANSFGPGSKENPGHEEQPFVGSRYKLGYIETKLEAQGLIGAAVRDRGLPGIVAAPTFMIGPNDSKPGSGQLIIAIVERSVPGYSKGGKNYVYVKDVATAVANALKAGRIGETYILGNENLYYKEFFSLVAEIAGVRMPKIAVPNSVVKATGVFGSLSGTLFRSTPKVTLPMARLSVETFFYSPAKAVAELELPQTPIATAVSEAIDWFRDHDYLPSV